MSSLNFAYWLRRYYRDANIISIYTFKSGEGSLAGCAQTCAMDWELDAGGQPISLDPSDPSSILQETFLAQELCEAFIFNPKSKRCILLSGASPLNLRSSNHYYSGYLACPDPVGTFTRSQLEPPGNVVITQNCLAEPQLSIEWDGVASADGYIVNCFPATTPSAPLSFTTTGTFYEILSTDIPSTAEDYQCFISAFSYDAVSKGMPTLPATITSC